MVVKDTDVEMARCWASAAEMLSITETAMKTLLLAEDSQDDIFAMKMACRRTGIPHLLQIVTDGAMAMAYLAGKDGYVDRTIHPLPELIFLDINMPKRNGHEVLEWVRSQPGLKELPVVMLSSSIQRVDVDRAYLLGVTSYLQKVPNLGEFGQAVRVVLKYWLELNIAPA
jgi:CheY-like chemotaxis protein